MNGCVILNDFLCTQFQRKSIKNMNLLLTSLEVGNLLTWDVKNMSSTGTNLILLEFFRIMTP